MATAKRFYWIPIKRDAFVPVQLVDGSKGQCVRFMDGSQQTLPIGEDVEIIEADKIPQDHKSHKKSKSLQYLIVADSSSLQPVEDLIKRTELSEPSILHNLRMRYEKNEIYTAISSIVISINPYKSISGLYGPTRIQLTRAALNDAQSIPPHVYVIADAAYKKMQSSHKNQAILVSGESGAGKTVSASQVLQYLAEVSADRQNSVETKLLQASPILEAFGNAKTIRNDNSSRFGKLVEVNFDARNKLNSGKITSYLLEKSRVVHHALGERNYHIFYAFCLGASEEERLQFALRMPEHYRILSFGGVANGNDGENFSEIRSAMDILEFTNAEKSSIMRCLAAILHCGNLLFISNAKDHAIPSNPSQLKLTADILQVSEQALLDALTVKRITAAGETIVKHLDVAAAEARRDALCKNLYDALFSRIISLINHQLYRTVPHRNTIYVLDVYGFERFECNTFAQLLINYANEKLQQHFVEQVLIMEQKEYVDEGVSMPSVEIRDFIHCLALLEGRSTGIIDLIADEVRMPKGSDTTLLDKLHHLHESHPNYLKPKTKMSKFGIRHYAQVVDYTVDGFLETSKDVMSEELVVLLENSHNTFIASILSANDAATSNSSSEESVMLNPSLSTRGNVTPTLGVQFRAQLSMLMDLLKSTDPWFIRCIKPTESKLPDDFDGEFVLRQLQYLGVASIIKVRQQGFSIRFLFADFIRRYSLLGSGITDRDPAIIVKNIITNASIPANSVAIGHRKVFLKQHAQTALDVALNMKISFFVTQIQALYRGRLARQMFSRLRTAVLKLQTLLESKTESIESLDVAIDQALEVRAPKLLIFNAKNYRDFLLRLLQIRKTLITATQSRDVALLTTAINKAHAAGFEHIYEFQTASDFLLRINKHRSDLIEACESHNIDSLRRCLLVAADIGIDTPLERDARLLIRRLEEETIALDSLQSATTSGDLESMRRAVRVAEELGLQHTQIFADSKTFFEVLQHQEHTRTLLKQAVVAEDRTFIETVLEQAFRDGLQSDPLTIEAQSALKALEKESFLASEVGLTLQSAINSVDLNLLKGSIEFAAANGVVSHPLLSQARELIEELTRRASVAHELSKAIQKRNVTILSQSMQIAEEYNFNDMEEYRAAADLKARLEGAIDSLRSLACGDDLSRIDSVLEDASSLGLSTDNDAFQAALARRDHLAHIAIIKRDVLIAIANDDADMLMDILNRSTSLLDDVSILKEARVKLAALQREAAIHEQDMITTHAVAAERTRRISTRGSYSSSSITPSTEQVTANLNGTDSSFLKTPISSEASTIALTPLPTKLQYPNDLDYFKSSQFQLHLAPLLRAPDDFARGKFLGKAKLKSGMLLFSRDVIPRSLTRLGDEDDQDPYNLLAIQIFKSILGFCNDRAYSFPDSLACDVLAAGVKNEFIRDEIYCQLMKQLTQNSRIDSVLRVWQLFALTTETFFPSSTFLPFVFHFLLFHSAEANINLEHHLGYVLYSINRLQLNRPSTMAVPSIEYVLEFRSRLLKSAFISFYLPEGSTTQLLVMPTMTAADVVEHLVNVFRIPEEFHDEVCLVAVSEDQEDQLLEPTAHPLDFATTNIRLEIRKYMLPADDIACNDSTMMSIIYHSLLSCCYRGRFGLTRADLICIAAIHAKIASQTSTQALGLHTYSFVQSQIGFVYEWSDTDLNAFEEDVQRALMEDRKPADTRHLLDYLYSACPGQVGGVWFEVTDPQATFGLELLLLCVNLIGISLFDPENRNLLHHYPYAAVTGWAANSSKVCFRVYGSDQNIVQLTFYTRIGKRITGTIENFIRYIVQRRKNKR